MSGYGVRSGAGGVRGAGASEARSQNMDRRCRGSASDNGMPSRTAELAAQLEIGEAIQRGEFVPCDPYRC